MKPVIMQHGVIDLFEYASPNRHKLLHHSSFLKVVITFCTGACFIVMAFIYYGPPSVGQFARMFHVCYRGNQEKLK